MYTGTITALDEDWNVVGAGDIREQTRKTIENLEKTLEAAGATLADVVKTTWYLTDITHMPIVAEIRNEMFGGAIPASDSSKIAASCFRFFLMHYHLPFPFKS
ncbi:RidA family protein [Peribacillus sp. SI8-4]|uniref:RidA family protein n=1 Tax=Peribacillus sp. SI8-4 TaxID=3048009 RepID=UPI00331DDBF7